MSRDITIFVLSYCRPNYLSESIASLLALNLTKDQIVILDNGSPQEMMASLRLRFDQSITWIGSSENKGVAWNLKRAFDLSLSKYFMVLHDDDRLISESITSQLVILNGDQTLVAISSNGYIIDPSGIRAKSLLLPNMPSQGIRYFKNSAQVAAHVYSDSCIPFSPMIYQTSAVKSLASNVELWHQNFGPVMDVVLQMSLADIGSIALNFQPLYECRSHSNQDSAFIDEAWNGSLREYCLQACNGSSAELNALAKQIPDAYTFALLYHLSKSICSFRFLNALSIVRVIKFHNLSFSGIVRFFKFGLFKIFK
jgi:glycosyltransferase involved in cell wall biosynthesis